MNRNALSAVLRPHAAIFAALFTPFGQVGARFSDPHPAVARDLPGLLQDAARLLDQFVDGESFLVHDEA
jgi:hypothetical protein